LIQKRLEMGEFGRVVKSFRVFCVMEKKRILWKHTVKVGGDTQETAPKAQEADDDDGRVA